MSAAALNVLSAFAGTLTVPAALALTLVLLIGLLRGGSKLRYIVMRRGRRPLVIQVDYGDKGLEHDENYGVLDARLLSYVSADGLGNYVVAPGAGGPTAPAVPAEASEPSAALVRLAVAKEPTFRVDVTWPGPRRLEGPLRATVRISRTPGDRIVATRSFAEESTDELVEVIGGFCLTFLLRQKWLLRSTPRWERWSQDVGGYMAYRRGLEHERIAETTPDLTVSQTEYKKALRFFHEAARVNPANILVQRHRAALLELTGDHPEAIALYRKCRDLWPENIEVAYRLGIAHKVSGSKARKSELLAALTEIEDWLRLSSLVRQWGRTWLPGHRNPGERRYWWSWINPLPWDRVSKRTGYRYAVALGRLQVELLFMLPDRHGRPPAELSDAERTAMKAMVVTLMETLADQLLHRDSAPAIDRLLRPELVHGGLVALVDQASPSYIPVYNGPHHRRRDVGWLALFNAACLFSLAIEIPDEYLPSELTAAEWRDGCARAAIRQLGLIHRDPRHALDPSWLATDPDLEALRSTEIGKVWQNFIGFPPPG